MPFDALVEVGGALGPTFEAQAVNVSEDGIQLRTAYLPEEGQTLTCRFDAGPGHNVLASGQVVWAQGGEEGGEFAVRFTDVDAESVEALKGICGVQGDCPVQAGSKVRLHIDGLASPMRAKIKDAQASAVTVGSDLGFLQVGRPLELEDAQSGQKRPANIDRVDVVVDPTSHIPQLVVTLRYSDGLAGRGIDPMRIAMAPEMRAPSPQPVAPPEELSNEAAMIAQMKGGFARGMAAVGPALSRIAQRAKTTAVLLAKRPSKSWEDGAAAKRTTAPAPGGGLHASGRRVVRGEAAPSSADLQAAAPRAPLHKNRTVLAGAVLVVAVAGALALKKGRHEPAEASAPAPVAAVAPPVAPAPAAPEPSSPPAPVLAAAPAPAPVAAADETADKSEKKHLRVTPFSNGPVHHGNILRLKMDAPLEAIEGAQQPTGFTVKLPGRKSLEAAAPLAARDSRIASIKISNDSAGAELTVVFKDGVPNYRVSAKGDNLIIALAAPGAVDATDAKPDAKKDDKTARVTKHPKRTHATDPSDHP
jgi:PilZ domain-containing protein